MPLDALTLPTRLRISFPPHKECLERELEPRTIAALQEDAARAYEELFSCELAPGNQRFHLYLMLDSDPTQPRVLLSRERQLTRYITVDDSGQFVVLRVQAEPQQEDLAGEIKKPEILFAEMAPRQPGSTLKPVANEDEPSATVASSVERLSLNPISPTHRRNSGSTGGEAGEFSRPAPQATSPPGSVPQSFPAHASIPASLSISMPNHISTTSSAAIASVNRFNSPKRLQTINAHPVSNIIPMSSPVSTAQSPIRAFFGETPAAAAAEPSLDIELYDEMDTPLPPSSSEDESNTDDVPQPRHSLRAAVTPIHSAPVRTVNDQLDAAIELHSAPDSRIGQGSRDTHRRRQRRQIAADAEYAASLAPTQSNPSVDADSRNQMPFNPMSQGFAYPSMPVSAQNVYSYPDGAYMATPYHPYPVYSPAYAYAYVTPHQNATVAMLSSPGIEQNTPQSAPERSQRPQIQAPANPKQTPSQSDTLQHHSKLPARRILKDRCDQHDHRGTCSRPGCQFTHVCAKFSRTGACDSPSCSFVHPCPLGDACPSLQPPVSGAIPPPCELVHVRPIRQCKFGTRAQCGSRECVMSHTSTAVSTPAAATAAVALCEFFNRRSGCLSLRTAAFICGRRHQCSLCGSPEHGAPMCNQR